MNGTDLPLTLTERLAPRQCALVVIDMQNDFCAPGGYIEAVMKKDVGAAAGIVDPLRTLLDAARAARVPVCWIGADYSRERIPASMRLKLDAARITADCCAPGSWGAQWFGVEPAAGETILFKHTYSGFSATPLDALLRDEGVRTVVCVGVQTQICVESTVREAHSLGYACVVPADAVASHTPALHDAALANIRFLFGDVSCVAEVCHAWATQAAR